MWRIAQQRTRLDAGAQAIHPLYEIVIETTPLQEGLAEQGEHCAMMDISNVPDCTAAALRRCASDPSPMRVWDRDNASGPPTLTDVQRRVHERMSEQLSMAGQIVAATTLVAADSHAEEETWGCRAAAPRQHIAATRCGRRCGPARRSPCWPRPMVDVDDRAIGRERSSGCVRDLCRSPR